MEDFQRAPETANYDDYIHIELEWRNENMDYSAGSSRQTIREASPTTNQNATSSDSPLRTRTYPTTGGSVQMNISVGGPHILLFERDQQLVALLHSELQLAGYEFHTARTAVEVFDTIARYPVRLVLVNLAQAAAARREFWVALDTQRRGRGVQVFTFHCTNIAGYGPSSGEETDDRSHAVLADLEIDGMSGIMNMVNAIRSRIAASNTGAMSRFTSNTNPQTSLGSQITVPIPTVQPPIQSISTPAEAPKMPNPNHTDKIRAVIYPTQRTWSTSRDTPSAGGNSQETATHDTSWSVRNPQNSAGIESASSRSSVTPPTAPTYVNTAATADPYRNNQGMHPSSEGTFPKESGLAQLSRMLQEHRAPVEDDAENTSTPLPRFQDESSMQQRVLPNDLPPISVSSMRASPIQDMPIDRINVAQSDTTNRRSDEFSSANPATSSSSPTLMSIATATPLSAMAQLSPVQPLSPTPTSPGQTAIPTAQPPQPEETSTPKPIEEVAIGNTPYYIEPEPASEDTSHGNMLNASNNDASSHSERAENTGSALAEQIQAVVMANAPLPEPTPKTPDNALLLDIVQSLPTMPSPPPQPPQIHQGRATRSLGSVLLEGHLVPQNRLEVALNIQRMLRGVDMNYQLGEILLMFKLLTPDQLLAASLISYGLITPAQISALGRIRQELHAIGLEYDLENLLILFRILTSEQLREVRSSWS